MLFGESTSYPQAEQLLGMCMEAGVNFFDTAEMYPVPQRAETQGASEEYLGRWLRSGAVRREEVLLASKVAGPSGQMTWIRGGPHKVDAANIAQALDASLRRLRTDYIDLYQIHWPDRYVPMFGDSEYDPSAAFEGAVPLEEQLEALGRAVEQGKVRYVGLSNETPWGLCKALALADTPRPHTAAPPAAGAAPAPPPAALQRLPRVASLQNAYSLTCRTFDSGGLAEVCHLEGVGLLAYSPLAMGLLTGKYLAADGGPPGARLNRYRGRYAEAESRYGPRPNVVAAVAAYTALAAEVGMSPTALALRFVLSRPLVSSAVVGATSPEQLAELLQAAAGEGERLPEEVLRRIDEIHERYPNPTP
ncbi:hypothetical protein HYH02_012640 [Chlamydomonas schloesseri]|uniref:NADP-dependent oxidoreductase domain-containing protein n=1 Tax=Chlamydomonas schloesseri TaxID=2026947 RepID=A0A835SUE0_9CHLO|nr:hypothetical protein HYH02_012640 [Chlamydomonas schloesseri]|eukprot:KAG2433522.1 hypothetical protein HYH02_012640 [Chlamydomonas schloesseri]